MTMRSITVPPWLIHELASGNPYTVGLEPKVQEAYNALASGEKEIADRLASYLANFPPRHDDFDILHITYSAVGGYRVEVATSTHIKITLIGVYVRVPRKVSITHVIRGRRKVEDLKPKSTKKKGSKP